MEFNDTCEDSASSETSDTDVDYTQETCSEPHFPSKMELNDLIRDLRLTKSAAELLTEYCREEFEKFTTFLTPKSAEIGQFSSVIGQFSK